MARHDNNRSSHRSLGRSMAAGAVGGFVTTCVGGVLFACLLVAFGLATENNGFDDLMVGDIGSTVGFVLVVGGSSGVGIGIPAAAIGAFVAACVHDRRAVRRAPAAILLSASVIGGLVIRPYLEPAGRLAILESGTSAATLAFAAATGILTYRALLA